MHVRAALTVLVFLVLPAAPNVSAFQEPDPLQALVEQERVRAFVDSAFERATRARIEYQDPTVYVEAYTDIVVELGTTEFDVVALLANELLQGDPATFFLTAHALALHGTPDAVTALRAAIARADREGTGFAEARKSHLIWTLAIAGDAGAIELADSGRHRISEAAIHRSMTVLEAAAVLTAPASVELLHARLREGDPTDPDVRSRQRQAIRALGRVGDPSSVPVLVKMAQSPSDILRQTVADALRNFTQPQAVDALIQLAADEDFRVAGVACWSLSRVLPRDRFEAISKLLEKTTVSTARALLYMTLAELDPIAALPILQQSLGRPDPVDRQGLYEALGATGVPAAVDLLSRGLSDPDTKAVVKVLHALARLDAPKVPRLILRAIDSPQWPVAQTASTLAVQKRYAGAADSIRHRLIVGELPRLVKNPSARLPAEWLIPLLVQLEDTAAIEGLAENLSLQKDPILLAAIDRATRQLRLVRDAGDDLERWGDAATGSDPQLYEVAYRHLSRVQGPSSAEATAILVRAFGRVEPEYGRMIVRFLGEMNGSTASDLIERVLTAEEFQRPELYELRDDAAWAARRIGGERMIAALRRAVEIRRGRDGHALIYYAILAGRESIPFITEWLVPRMRLGATLSGNEYNHLRRVTRRLEQGFSLYFFDQPREKLTFAMR